MNPTEYLVKENMSSYIPQGDDKILFAMIYNLYLRIHPPCAKWEDAWCILGAYLRIQHVVSKEIPLGSEVLLENTISSNSKFNRSLNIFIALCGDFLLSSRKDAVLSNSRVIISKCHTKISCLLASGQLKNKKLHM